MISTGPVARIDAVALRGHVTDPPCWKKPSLVWMPSLTALATTTLPPSTTM